MDISPIAYYRGPFGSKFGIPRQSSVIEDIGGRIVFEPAFRSRDAVKGLEGFDWLWLIWGFSANQTDDKTFHATVRPPRLGGNRTVGVFASRSPFRPNPLGLSSVRIKSIDFEKGEITVLGADLADGTPVYDIKPYVTYCDSHPEARSGFVDQAEWKRLEVLPSSPETEQALNAAFDKQLLSALYGILAEDPRPKYHDDPAKEYGLSFGGYNIIFKVEGGRLLILSISPESQGLF